MENQVKTGNKKKKAWKLLWAWGYHSVGGVAYLEWVMHGLLDLSPSSIKPSVAEHVYRQSQHWGEAEGPEVQSQI